MTSKISAAVLLALSLAACSSPQQSDNVQIQQQKTIAGLAVAVTAAEQAALAYVTKPVCNGQNGPDGLGCATPATVTAVKAAGQRAHDAVKAANDAAAAGGTPDIAAINSALAALNAAFPHS
jgi:hypothetical protein